MSPDDDPTAGTTRAEQLLYKPFGIVFGLLGGLIAGKVFAVVWKRVSGEDETPAPLSDDYSTREVLLAATLQGAVFALIRTAVDRYGMKAYRRFLHAGNMPGRRRART